MDFDFEASIAEPLTWFRSAACGLAQLQSAPVPGHRDATRGMSPFAARRRGRSQLVVARPSPLTAGALTNGDTPKYGYTSLGKYTMPSLTTIRVS